MTVEPVNDDKNEYLEHRVSSPSVWNGREIREQPSWSRFQEIKAALVFSLQPSKKLEQDVTPVILDASIPPFLQILEKNGLMFANASYDPKMQFTYALDDGSRPDVILCKNFFKKAWKGAKKGIKQLGKNVKSLAQQGWHEITKGAGKANDWVKAHAGNGGGPVEAFGFDFGPNQGAPPPQPGQPNFPLEADLLKPHPLAQGNPIVSDPFNAPAIAQPFGELMPHNPLAPPLNFAPNPNNPGNFDLDHLSNHPHFFADSIQPEVSTSFQTSTSGQVTPANEERILTAKEPEEEPGLVSLVVDMVKMMFVKDLVHPVVEAYGWLRAQAVRMGNAIGLGTGDLNTQLAEVQQDVKSKHEGVDDTFGTGYAILYDPGYLELKRAIGLDPTIAWIPFGPGLFGRAAVIQSTGIELRALHTLRQGLAFEDVPLALREIRTLQSAGGLEITAQNVFIYEHPEAWFRIRVNGVWEIEGRSIKSFDFGKLGTQEGKLGHLFDIEHQFDKLGCPLEDILSKTTRAIVEADRAGNIPLGEAFKIRVPVDGFEVEVRGIVLDGELRYGTIFIPKNK